VVTWPISRGTGIEFRIQRGGTYTVRGKPTGWLISDREQPNNGNGLHARSLKKDKIDWNVVTEWLNICKAGHGGSCGVKRPFLVQDFQVIQCSTRRIVPLPENQRYAALSYPWGPAEAAPEFMRKIPASTPRVIEDAIICTEKIGLNYLWVDRLCINQANSKSKHEIIHSMDKIYHNATVTIIDAAGIGPRFGLPGVSQTERQTQASIYFNKQKFISISNARQDVMSSKWAKRGWTYQEGLLARRRLVFTRSQVYFQCLDSYFCESVAIPANTESRAFRRETDLLREHLRVFPLQGVGFRHEHLLSRIEEYLSRQLSHDSDILYAFMGILSHFHRLQNPIHSFWGLPFDSSNPGKVGSTEIAFLTSLLWMPTMSEQRARIGRRQNFPSWSWVGWKGIRGIRPDPNTLTTCSIIRDVAIELETDQGQYTSISEYIQTIQDGSCFNHHRFGLRLSGWITFVRLQPYRQPSLNGDRTAQPVNVLDRDGQHVLSQATVMTHWIADNPIPDPYQLCCELWPIFLYLGRMGVVCGLVLRPIKEATYERLGVLPYMKVDPWFHTDAKFCHLVRRDYGPPHRPLRLDCEWRTINLV
jgi:hypothetical protein